MITINDYTVHRKIACSLCALNQTDGFTASSNIDYETGEILDIMDPIEFDGPCEVCGRDTALYYQGVILEQHTITR